MKVIPSHIEVDYNDEDHRYFMGPVVYRSSTQIIEQFTQHFDTAERAEYMADRYGQTPEYWKAKWAEGNGFSLERGNMLHDDREAYVHNRGFDTINGKHFRVYNLNQPHIDNYWRVTGGYMNLPDGTYPEMKLWNHTWHIAGRSDKPTIETVNRKRYYHIDDYKTNKRIEDQSFYDYKTDNFRMMTGPLSHLMDCNLVHYTLQLSLYQFMAEGFGFLPGKRRIIHYPHEIEGLGVPPPKIIELPYLRAEVLLMLKHLKLNRWLN